MTLYDLITPGGANPAWWNCPIQEGIPLILTMAYRLLIFGAGLAFFIGILTAVFYYLTAYGDEAKAKKGKEALKWTVIGSLIIMFSALGVYWVTRAFIDDKGSATLTVLGDNTFVLRGLNGNDDLVQLGKGTTSTCGTPAPTEEEVVTPAKTTETKKGTVKTDDKKKIYTPSATK
jgi:hypothetical protein